MFRTKLVFPSKILIGEILARRTSCRWRHSRLRDLSPAERFRKIESGTKGPAAPVRSPETVPGLRRSIADIKHGTEAVALLEEAANAAAPDFAKAIQRCGELRDYTSLCKVMRLQSVRGVPCTRQQYGIIFFALARASLGADGRNSSAIERERCLQYGKAIYKDIMERKVQLTSPEFGGALALCSKAGDADWALDIWAQVHKQGITPDERLLTTYLSALANHGGETGWQMVKSEVCKIATAGNEVGSSLLAVLLNAAGTQHNADRAEWSWSQLSPLVSEPSSVLYCGRARALILCGLVSNVPPLLEEMERRSISPNYRLYKNVTQAHLLLLHGSPSLMGHLEKMENLMKLANQQRRQQPVGRNEIKEFERMLQCGRRLVAGEKLHFSDVRVEHWPWPKT